MRHLRLGVALAALVVPAVVAQAQEVSSTISGVVLSKAGSPLAGAKIEILHVPTGTRVMATTGAEGQFTASGLRVGGPFSVTITADGYQGQTISEIRAGAGENFGLTAELEMSDAAETIVVVASSLRKSGLVTAGSATVLSSKDLASITSVNRDIRDAAARDPMTSFDPVLRGISIAGASARANRFTIDGVSVQDDFGLNLGGLPSLRGIVSLEAIGQLAIKTAPFDVGQGNFTGGAIDAVLKSGTNEFHAVAYGSIGGRGLTGRELRGSLIPEALPFRNYGVFASGPIIKDKLFVALNYERLTEGSQLIASGINGEGFANSIPNIGAAGFGDDRAVVNSIIGTTNTRYRYDPLDTFQQESERDRKISAKIDWNIAEGQRLSLTYIDHFNSVPLPGGGSSNSNTSPNVGLKSNSYEGTEATKVYTGQLNSQWNDKLSTEVRLSYRDYVRGQVGYEDQGFGQFQVCTNPTSIITGTGPTNNNINCGVNARVTLGTDSFRQSNSLATNNLNFQFNIRYNAGNHRIKFQAEGVRQRVNNVFVPNSRGNFYFDSIADFQAGNANRVTFANAINGDPTVGGAAIFTLYSYAFGIQDEWAITDNLTALIGARYDAYSFDDSQISFNQSFTNRYGFRNTASIDGVSVFQPRVGFNWKANDRTRVSGGVGIFSGGVPLVLFSNSLANDGARLNTIDLQRDFNAAGLPTGTFTDLNNRTTDPVLQAQINAAGAAALNNVDGFGLQRNAVVNRYLSTNLSSLAQATTNTVDPNFRMNSVLRANLSAEYSADLGFLGDGWDFRFDVAHTWNRNSYTMIDLRAIPNGTLPDGRPRYQGIAGSAGNDLQLTTRTGGVSFVTALSVAKEWMNGISIQAAYTRSRVTDFLTDTGGTTAAGSYNVVVRDPNQPDIATSTLQTGNQVRLTLNYRKALFGDNETNFQIFGLYRQGRPFSYTFSDPAPGRGNVFGTTGGNRYLLYVPNLGSVTIPTGTASVTTQIDPRVQFSGTPAQLQAFRDFILGSELAGFQGQIARRGIARNPDWYTINLHFSQQLPTFVGNSKFTVFADMENFLNLLSDKFAFRELPGRAQQARLVEVQCLSATGTVLGATGSGTSLTTPCASYRYSNFQAPVLENFQRQSVWAVRVGARLEF